MLTGAGAERATPETSKGSALCWQTASSSMRKLPACRRQRTVSWSSFACTAQRFPNLRMDPEDVLAIGDKVVARVRATGTHDGELMGMPATGKSVDVQLIDIMRFDKDGLSAEHWGVVDMMAMMQQLGVVGSGAAA
jgi:predicted ester cyclase